MQTKPDNSQTGWACIAEPYPAFAYYLLFCSLLSFYKIRTHSLNQSLNFVPPGSVFCEAATDQYGSFKLKQTNKQTDIKTSLAPCFSEICLDFISNHSRIYNLIRLIEICSIENIIEICMQTSQEILLKKY